MGEFSYWSLPPSVELLTSAELTQTGNFKPNHGHVPNFLSLSSILHKEEPSTARVAHLTFYDESGNLPRLFMQSILIAAPKEVASSVQAARAATVTVTK